MKISKFTTISSVILIVSSLLGYGIFYYEITKPEREYSKHITAFCIWGLFNKRELNNILALNKRCHENVERIKEPLEQKVCLEANSFFLDYTEAMREE